MAEPELSGRQPKAIERALRVLEVVAGAGPGVTAKQIAEALGLPPATTYRLLTVLVAEEYVVRLPDLSGFALGRRALELALDRSARAAGAHSPPPRPALGRQQLAGVTDLVRGWSGSLPVGVHLAAFDGARLSGLHSHDPAGTRPADLTDQELADRPHASAIGKLLLAEEPAALLRIAGRLHPVTARTVTDTDRLGSELVRVREEGLSQQDGELRAGLLCLAAPLRGPGGRLTGALAVSMPSSATARTRTRRAGHPDLAELGALLRRCAGGLAG